MVFSHSSYSNYAQNEYAVLPPIDTNIYNDITGLHLTFYAKTSRLSAPFPMFIVGVMVDYADTATFVPVDTVYLSNT